MSNVAIKVKNLKEGQRFWNFKEQFGDPNVEAMIKDGVQVWADGDTGNCVAKHEDSFVYAVELI